MMNLYCMLYICNVVYFAFNYKKINTKIKAFEIYSNQL